METRNRPKSLDDFVFANDELERAIRAYCSGDVTRSLILFGKYGTGKSLLAELIPKEIEGFSPDVNYVRPYDYPNKRDLLKKMSRDKQFDKLYSINGQRFNYWILEEMCFDAATSRSYRVILDEYKGLDISIITTNEIDKIDSGIRSRCEVIEVPAVAPARFLQRAKSILASEGFDIADNTLMKLLDITYRISGDNRSYYKKLDELLHRARQTV